MKLCQKHYPGLIYRLMLNFLTSQDYYTDKNE